MPFTCVMLLRFYMYFLGLLIHIIDVNFLSTKQVTRQDHIILSD